MSEKLARIRVTCRTERVGHPCRACEWNASPIVFEGKVNDRGLIEWPVAFGYHISYCPHCGGELPKERKAQA